MKKNTTDDELLRAVEQDIETAENYYEAKIRPQIEEAVNVYNADKDYYSEKFPELSKRSTFTTKDVANTVDAIMPDMMRILLGGSEVVSLKPVGAEDVESADGMQDLVKHQFMSQNKGYKLTYRWVKASLYKKIGLVKCVWDRETEWVEQKHAFYLNNPQDWQAYTQLIEMVNAGKVKSKTSEQLENGLFTMTCEHENVTKNQPRIDYMNHSEFLFIPTNIEINESIFTAQKITLTVSDLRQKVAEGVYSKADVDEVIAKAGYNSSSSYSASQTDDTAYQDDKSTYEDEGTQSARKPILVYECYGRYDMDGSEIMEDMIVTVANGVILRKEKNEMIRHPFFPMMPLLEPDDIIGKCLTDLVADFQHLKIAMLRQVIVNTALSNKPKYFYNSKAINGAYLSEDLEYIPVTSDTNVNINNLVAQEQVTNIAPWTLKLLEYNDNQKQETSGITSYSMGLEGGSNKSGTKGEAEILNMNGNKRIQMIARNVVETGFVELFTYMTDLNIKYMDPQESIRLLGKPINTDPATFSTKYDVTVSAGLGLGSAEQNMKAMQVVGTFFTELLPLMQLFMANPILYDKFRNQKAKILEEMGVKDIDTYLPTKEEMFPQQQGPPQGQGQPQPPQVGGPQGQRPPMGPQRQGMPQGRPPMQGRQ